MTLPRWTKVFPYRVKEVYDFTIGNGFRTMPDIGWYTGNRSCIHLNSFVADRHMKRSFLYVIYGFMHMLVSRHFSTGFKFVKCYCDIICMNKTNVEQVIWHIKCWQF